MTRWILACAVACLLFAVPVSAQVTEGQPFDVAFDHTGQNADGYRLYVDNVQLGANLPPIAGTTTVTVPGLSAGPHVLQASAFNTGGESKGNPLAVTVTATAPPPVTPPADPTNLRLVTTTALRLNADGTVDLLASSTEVLPVP